MPPSRPLSSAQRQSCNVSEKGVFSGVRSGSLIDLEVLANMLICWFYWPIPYHTSFSFVVAMFSGKKQAACFIQNLPWKPVFAVSQLQVSEELLFLTKSGEDLCYR